MKTEQSDQIKVKVKATSYGDLILSFIFSHSLSLNTLAYGDCLEEVSLRLREHDILAGEVTQLWP